jgi:hypothetical protein
MKTVNFRNISIFIIPPILIYIYVLVIQYNHPNDADHTDILNKSLLTINVCGWNLLHVLFFYVVCYTFQVNTILDHIIVFFVGVVWFIFEKIMFYYNNKHINININTNNIDNNASDVYHPISNSRVDDFIFNAFGQILYIITLWARK